MNNAYRWGLVTFGLGFTSGTLGHFLTDGGAAFAAISLVSVIFAMVGTAVIEWNGDKP